MSWDVLLIRTKNNNEKFDDIQEDDMIPFSRKEIIDSVIRISEEINVNAEDIDSDFIHLRSENWSVQFNLNDDEYYSITLEIRGKEEPQEALFRLEKYLNARIFDMSSGEFIDEQKKSGFLMWKNFCDKIMKNLSENNKL